MSVSCKPYKSKSFHMLHGDLNHYPSPKIENIKSYLNQIIDKKLDLRFFIRSGNNIARYVKAITVLRAINRGHHDLEIWQYCHEIKKLYYDRNTGDMTVIRKMNYCAFVLDIDQNIFNGAQTPDDIEDYLLNVKKFPKMPSKIICTSKDHVHLEFVKQTNWTWDEKKTIVCLLLGINYLPEDDEMRSICYNNGIDWVYFRGHKNNAPDEKIRIPGSWRVKDGRYTLVTGKSVKSHDSNAKIPELLNKSLQQNINWLYENPKVVSITSQTQKSAQKSDQIIEQKSAQKSDQINQQKSEQIIKKNQEQYYNQVYEIIESCIKCRKKNVINIFTNIIIENVTRFMNGNMNMSQLELSKKTGIPQKNISRYLKDLRESGLLRITEEHVFNPKFPEQKKATLYAFGDNLLKKINFSDCEYDIYEEYQNGMTVDHLLADIRHLYLSGYDSEDIVEFCYYKQQVTRPYVHKTKIREHSELEKTVENFAKKKYIDIKRRRVQTDISILMNKLKEEYVSQY